jgi:hypothetical protein
MNQVGRGDEPGQTGQVEEVARPRAAVTTPEPVHFHIRLSGQLGFDDRVRKAGDGDLPEVAVEPLDQIDDMPRHASVGWIGDD